MCNPINPGGLPSVPAAEEPRGVVGGHVLVPHHRLLRGRLFLLPPDAARLVSQTYDNKYLRQVYEL